ncbi:MAG: hypothetical protein HYZ37_06655 [Candidatus Solibacter usitatus]|nr:hypothetical protein [Candidatus Solibacter usitatus]
MLLWLQSSRCGRFAADGLWRGHAGSGDPAADLEICPTSMVKIDYGALQATLQGAVARCGFVAFRPSQGVRYDASGEIARIGDVAKLEELSQLALRSKDR